MRALLDGVAIVFLSIVSLVACYVDLSTESLKAIPTVGNDFDIHNGKLLAPLLQPRVPGTAGSERVRRHLTDFFASELPEWKITYQNSTQKTPVSGNEKTPFINVIATRDPPGSNAGETGYLTLVAHYDSKLEPEGFIGATDSAAPCAMLMQIARSLEPALKSKWSFNTGAQSDDFEEAKGVKILFLDGEEAFKVWNHQDSVYGARSLAEEMESTLHPALSTYHNELSSLSLFVLLDLLGSSDPIIPSYFKITDWAFQKLASVAKRLQETTKLVSNPTGTWFRDGGKQQWLGGLIEDDHIPFMARGVDVLHIIPSPFPHVWHKMEDDGEHLDIEVCKDWAVVMTAFAAEWMDLDGHLVAPQRRDAKAHTISKTEL